MSTRRPSTGGAAGGNARVPAPTPGDKVGNYQVLERIGSGAMGRVYKVVDVRDAQFFAMKTLRGRYAFDGDAVSRFFLEAEAIASLQHDHVVAVRDFVDDAPWPPSFIMELLEGETLAERIDRDGPLRLRAALSMAYESASAIVAAHDKQIVHRDLKPENVFLAKRAGRDDFVKILDFGVAKLLDDSIERKHETAVGRQIGTPGYMSPEQVLGAPVDHRADIYALGIVLFEALTGRLPHAGKDVRAILTSIASKDAPAPSSLRPTSLEPVPAAVDDIVLACLKKQASDRPQSMAEVLRALTAVAVAT